MKIPTLTEAEKSTVLDATMKTKKVKLPALKDRTDANLAMLELATLVNSARKINADRDAAIIVIQQRVAPELIRIKKAIEVQTSRLHKWAESHPEEFPKDVKSLDLDGGKIGFRINPPKLALLNRKWDWDAVTEAVSQLLPNFIRNKPEVDKEAIIRQREELKEFLPKVGIKVAQDDGFCVDPKLTTAPTRQTQS